MHGAGGLTERTTPRAARWTIAKRGACTRSTYIATVLLVRVVYSVNTYYYIVVERLASWVGRMAGYVTRRWPEKRAWQLCDVSSSFPVRVPLQPFSGFLLILWPPVGMMMTLTVMSSLAQVLSASPAQPCPVGWPFERLRVETTSMCPYVIAIVYHGVSW